MIITTNIATPTTACIAMPAPRQESVLGAPVQGGRKVVGTTMYAFGVQIDPASLKGVSMGVRAWNPPD